MNLPIKQPVFVTRERCSPEVSGHLRVVLCENLVRLSKLLREDGTSCPLISKHYRVLFPSDSIRELFPFGTDVVVDAAMKKQWVQWNCSAAVGVVCVM